MHKEKKKVVKTQIYKGDKNMKHLKNRATIVKKRRTNGRL